MLNYENLQITTKITNEDNITDLFIKEDDNTESEENHKTIIDFSSSDEDDNNRDNCLSTVLVNATNANNVSNMVNVNFIDQSLSDTKDAIDTTNLNSNSLPNMVENMLKPSNINGWDDDANTTIKNWYKTFKQQSFIYQWTLDHNNQMAEKLAILSMISSGILGIFAGFKLWIPDNVFQTVSNIILILCNFGVALITALSRRYSDDKRSEAIKTYINDVDEFLGVLSAQVLKSPVYRTNADDFFCEYNNEYTKLISSAPNMTIEEIYQAKNEYQKYLQQDYLSNL